MLACLLVHPDAHLIRGKQLEVALITQAGSWHMAKGYFFIIYAINGEETLIVFD